MDIKTLIVSLTLMYPIVLSAQTVIEGTVLNVQHKAVDAYVTVSPKGASSILSFANADAKGRYRLEFKSDADTIVVTVSGMTIGNQVKVLTNRPQHLDFLVKEQCLQLKEVIVKAPKIRQSGDTLNYNVASYTQQGDRVIGDVLKKMPGMEVSQNGGISFNGKSISNFYVEDMDLLQGRYGLATNNINAKDVTTVQVLENHQPVKVLQGKKFTDDVAINLKLKNSAKGTLSANTMLGGGLQSGQTIGGNPLWTAELVGMYFSKRRQNMTLYKGNNTGDDVAQELEAHYSSINSVGLYPLCPANAILPSGSGLPQKRTFDNRSHIVTANHLEKLDNNTELSMNLSYHNDLILREETSGADRFVSDDRRLQTSEMLTSETYMNNLQAQVRYSKNVESDFLTNVLNFSSSWNSDNVSGMLTSSYTGAQFSDNGSGCVTQHFHRPELSVSNTVNAIRNFGKTMLDLHFSAGYAQRPNTLDVGVDSLSQGTKARYVQDITSRHIAANFNTSYDLRLGYFNLSYGVVADMNLHGIRTDLNGFTPSKDFMETDLQNDLWYNTCEFALAQNYTYHQRGWRAELGCPLELYTQMLDDRIRKNRISYSRLLVMPSSSVSYEWNDWSGSIRASYAKTVGDPRGIYSGYIMNNYRSFQRSYTDKLSENDRTNCDVSLVYRSAMYAAFVRLNASYTHTRDNQIYGYDYHGATSVIQAVDYNATSDAYNVGIDVSKGFDWLQATLRIIGSYNRFSSEELITQHIYPYHSNTYNIGAWGTVTPLRWLNFVLSSGYSWSKSFTDGNENGLAQTVRSAIQQFKMNVFATKELSLTAIIEDNYNNLTDTNCHAWFGDVQMKYKLKRIDLELDMNNVFNQKTYTRVNYSNLDIYTSTSQLRPFNVIATVRFKLL